MITVKKRGHKDEDPHWLRRCPHCQDNDSDVYVEISSGGIYVHFALCEACSKELSSRLKSPQEGSTTKTRQEIQREECTVNPIFLFQKGVVRIGVGAPVEYDPDTEEMICTITGKPITGDEIVEEGYGWVEWLTEHVWETREEAEEWGRTHAYRYRACDGKDGRPGNEWRVYCVPCAGELARRLNDTKV